MGCFFFYKHILISENYDLFFYEIKLFYRSSAGYKPIVSRWMAQFKSNDEKQKTLLWTKDLYESLIIFEPLADACDYIKDLLGAMLWPTSIFCREVIVGCFESDFSDFALESQRDLDKASKIFTVKAVEDTHRGLNTKQRQNMNGKLGRHSRWHTALTCKVIEEIDRQLPTITQEHRRAAASDSLTVGSYDVKNNSFSLGEQAFSELLTQKDTKCITYTSGQHHELFFSFTNSIFLILLCAKFRC